MPDLSTLLDYLWFGTQVALGVGFVIFVHELGHFAVAKFCGVKCEKFYLGFDIGGWKICKFRSGETEYGIGILPLGGYVKMLGQEDNPTKLKEEIERAKMEQAKDKPTVEGKTPADQLSTENPKAMTDFDLAEAQKALYDPRSYLAKSVPQRMAIISAGVIMNVIFAFLMAVVAYAIGVEQVVCRVGEVSPGEAAWRADLQPGDRLAEIAGQKVGRFKDLQKNIIVGDIDEGVTILIERPGEKELIKKVVHPDRFQLAPTIGMTNAYTTNLAQTRKDMPPVFPGSSASKAEPPLKSGEKILAINGEKIEGFQQIQAYLANHTDQPLNITMEEPVEQKNSPPDGAKPRAVREVVVPPQPMRALGLVMKMGTISAIQDDSPAKKAGLQAGDRLLAVNSEPIADPMRLPDLFKKLAGKPVKLTVQRGKEKLDIDVMPQRTDAVWVSNQGILTSVEIGRENFPMVIPQLGLAYLVENQVERVLPGSPAEKAGIRAGEVIHEAKFLPPEKKVGKDAKTDEIELESFTLSFDKKNQNWPLFFLALQVLPSETQIELTMDKDRKVKVQPVKAADWFFPDRGILLEADTYFQKAGGIIEAVRLGASETWESLTMVVKFLQKLQSRQVSPKALGGPGSIAYMAYREAKKGFASLLLFLTMLSANLAVLNVLPIPMLDGGHLVFLAYEGIRGKPADERVQIALSVIGLVLLLALMIFVVGLDVQRFWPK